MPATMPAVRFEHVSKIYKSKGNNLRALDDGGALWIVWPKKSAGVASDLDGNAVRAFGLANGLVDYKVCAVDATWSGLCFARRKHE